MQHQSHQTMIWSLYWEKYCTYNRDIFCFLAIFIGVAILLMRDRSYELRKMAAKKATSETDNEVKNEVNQSKPVHWARTLTKSQLKDIGRAFVQPSLLIVILSAIFRQTGLYLYHPSQCNSSPWMYLEVQSETLGKLSRWPQYRGVPRPEVPKAPSNKSKGVSWLTVLFFGLPCHPVGDTSQNVQGRQNCQLF